MQGEGDMVFISDSELIYDSKPKSNDHPDNMNTTDYKNDCKEIVFPVSIICNW
jgi:hypothetical protein